MIQQRQKVPKRKRLISNQVLITRKIKSLRNEFINDDGLLGSDAFRLEPVIFVPRLQNIVKNMDLQEMFQSCEASQISIPINCIHSDEGLENNIEDIRSELRDRQLDYGRKLSGDEEDSIETTVEQRSLRFRQRMNYNEGSPLDEEIFQTMINKPRFFRQKTASEQVTEDEEETKEWNRFTAEETKLLEKWFNKTQYPDHEERKNIGEILKIPASKVGIWFQNKRKSDDGKLKSPSVRSSMHNSDSGTEEDDLQVCKTCNQTFTTRTDFQIHCKRVHGGDGDKIVCRECLKTFDTAWNLKTHCIELHSKSGIKLCFIFRLLSLN